MVFSSVSSVGTKCHGVLKNGQAKHIKRNKMYLRYEEEMISMPQTWQSVCVTFYLIMGRMHILTCIVLLCTQRVVKNNNILHLCSSTWRTTDLKKEITILIFSKFIYCVRWVFMVVTKIKIINIVRILYLCIHNNIMCKHVYYRGQRNADGVKATRDQGRCGIASRYTTSKSSAR